VDGWGRYTRWRKWGRDAELVEVEDVTRGAAVDDDGRKGKGRNGDGHARNASAPAPGSPDVKREVTEESAEVSSSSNAEGGISPAKKKTGWFGGGGGGGGSVRKARRATTVDRSDAVSKTGSTESARSREGEEDVHTPIRFKQGDYWDRSIGDGLAEGLS